MHGELYECVLPSLMLPDPLSDHCIPDWKGKWGCIITTFSLCVAAFSTTLFHCIINTVLLCSCMSHTHD